jgi:hypothetical protein
MEIMRQEPAASTSLNPQQNKGFLSSSLLRSLDFSPSWFPFDFLTYFLRLQNFD